MFGVPNPKTIKPAAKGRAVKAAYKFFVVTASGEIVAGNESRSDAVDAMGDQPKGQLGYSLSVVSRAAYERKHGPAHWPTAARIREINAGQF